MERSTPKDEYARKMDEFNKRRFYQNTSKMRRKYEHAVAIICRSASEAIMNEIRESPGWIECPKNRTLRTAPLDCLDHRNGKWMADDDVSLETRCALIG